MELQTVQACVRRVPVGLDANHHLVGKEVRYVQDNIEVKILYVILSIDVILPFAYTKESRTKESIARVSCCRFVGIS